MSVLTVVNNGIEEAASPLEALINIATAEPGIFFASLLLWSATGMFAWWAFIKKAQINPMLLSFLFGIVAIVLLIMVFYINPALTDLMFENPIAFLFTLGGSVVFGAIFLPFVLITLITAITGMQKG